MLFSDFQSSLVLVTKRIKRLTRRSPALLIFVLIVSFAFTGLNFTVGVRPAKAAPPVDCTGVGEIPLSECNVLIALYTQTNGAGWTNNSGWTTTTPCTTPWFGIACNVTNTSVVQINLFSNNLVGTIPSTLNSLTNLQVLGLYNNQLTGTIPSLTGLTSLTGIGLYGNQLTGTIPSLTGLTNLSTLSLSGNQLTGTIPALTGLTNLSTLSLSGNQLTGTIPALTGLTSLYDLNLATNQLTGTIPSLTGLTSLYSINLGANQLTGTIPVLAGLTNLNTLFLSNNQLSGTIPALTGLTSLANIDLSTNQLTGTIPALTGLTNLNTLNLSTNQLTGAIPSLTGSTFLINVELFSNQLTGSIPSLTGLTSLAYLQLQNNQLTGSIPSLTGSTSLVSILLFSNQLTGSIPSLTGLTSLADIALDSNQLTGTIPSLSGLVSLNTVHLGNNQFTGNVPDVPPSVLYLDVSSNLLNGTIPASLASSAIVSAANLFLCGTGNVLNPVNGTVNTFVAALIPSWAGSCSGAQANCALISEIPLTECNFLEALYTQTNGAAWTNKTNWTTTTPCSDPWFGITCIAGHVSQINLNPNNLVGTLPSTLNALTNLTVFNLGNNTLTGSLPTLTGMTSLQVIFLAYNQMSGSIPSLAGLISLQQLSLDHNQFSGPIPSFAGLTALTGIYIDTNQLTGTIPSVTGSPGLAALYVDHNQLTGSFPTLTGLASLQYLSLSNNQLTGAIPSLTGLTGLLSVAVNNNQFTGTVPDVPPSVNFLDVSSNLLNGTIPASLTLSAIPTTPQQLFLCGTGNLLTPVNGAVNTFIAARVPGWNGSCGNPPLSCATVVEIPLSECNFLVALYTQTNGATWANRSNWTTITPCSAPWFGITCTAGHVTSVVLTSNNLVGTIPSTLNALTNLKTFNLFFNTLSGTIPPLTGLTSLTTLDLSTNQLTGAIPSLTGLTSLTGVYLSVNQLTGPIPLLTGLTNLNQLILSVNQLTGPFPTLAGLTNLSFLFLDNNQLTGPIPALTSFASLTRIGLNNNKFTGNVPDVPPSVVSLDVSSNLLNGTIPASLTLSAIPTTPQALFLCGTGNLLTPVNGAVNTYVAARIPGWAGSCTGALANCALVSEIPLTECNFLEALYAQTNGASWTNTSGWSTSTPCSLPWYGITCTAGRVTSIILASNNLVGTIPSTLNALTNLQYLALSFNQLTGTIPGLTGLTNLSQVYLESNQLTGSIPTLSGLTGLQYLQLNFNHLTGTIPALTSLVNLKQLYLYNNQLTGTLPSFVGLTALQELVLVNNQLSGIVPADITGTVILPFKLNLCGGQNSLTPPDAPTNTWITARDGSWTSGIGCVPSSSSSGGSGGATGSDTPLPVQLNLTTPQIIIIAGDSVPLDVSFTNLSSMTLYNLVVIVEVPTPLVITSPIPICRQVTFNVGNVAPNQKILLNLLASVPDLISAAPVAAAPPNSPFVSFEKPSAHPQKFVPQFVPQLAPQSVAAARPRTLVAVVQATWDDQNVATASQVITLMPKATLPGTGEHPANSTPSLLPEMLAFAVGICGLFGFILLFATRTLRARSR